MTEKPINIPKTSKFLKGTGASAWFNIIATQLNNEFLISRYSEEGKKECENIFQIQSAGFNLSANYEIAYVSHCAKCTILQNKQKFVFVIKQKIPTKN